MLKFITKTVYMALVTALCVGLNVSVMASPCYTGLLTVQGTISATTTWSIDYHATGTITIPSGVVLTIRSTVKFEEGVSIIVQSGGSLVLEGTLTAACPDKLWEGVVITNNSPTLSSGKVSLRSNAMIEHALCAISVTQSVNQMTAQGAIQADGAVFLNNLQAIEYKNTASSPGIMRFTKCTFTIDDNNRFTINGKTFQYHVTLLGGRGTIFEGCDFNNKANVNPTGTGIYSIDSDLRVINYCSGTIPGVDCICPDYYIPKPTVFKNLAAGIYSENTGTPRTIHIDQSEFENLWTGVYMGGETGYRLTRCNFYNTLYGLHSINSSNYRIEENGFWGYGFGIWMENSGIANNRIYKNYFSGCRHGIDVVGINGTDSPIQGLQFTCNYFINNMYDIFIWDDATVCPHQGSLLQGADNVFTSTSYNSIYSYSSQTITYFHSPSNNHDPYNPQGNVIVNNNAKENKCLSTFCLPSGKEEEDFSPKNIAVESQTADMQEGVYIYPNPANASVTIHAKDFAKVEVYNTIGQLIAVRNVATFDISSYNSGIYFFKIYDTDNNVVTKRVMVVK